MFQVKYKVVDLEIENKELKKSIETTSRSIHTLQAEWSYLNDPKRLANLSASYLQVAPIEAGQIFKLDNLKAVFSQSAPPADVESSLDNLFSQAVNDPSLNRKW